MSEVVYGTSKRGKNTAIYNNYEYWKYRENLKGQVIWRCVKSQTMKCKATMRTQGDRVKEMLYEHSHSGNVATALARKAVGEMRDKMTETIATPTSSQGEVMPSLDGHVLMALPKKASLSRILRRHRHKENTAANGGLPLEPTDLTFTMPEVFRTFVLFDSLDADDRLIIFGDRDILNIMERSDVWIADGTFKVAPSLYFQLYSIHFKFISGINPVGLYCLLRNKTKPTYEEMLRQIKLLIPRADPSVILVDFERAPMTAFRDAYPDARVTGCYFHLFQSVIRKVNELGMKTDYETDDHLRGCVRCLPALSHLPAEDVLDSFLLLCEEMPHHERMPELLSYFEHTYIRGRRLPGRLENYREAIFPIDTWNQRQSAAEGIARTTNCAEGWHNSLHALFMCNHPTLWKFIDGLQKDCAMQKAAYLQGVTGSQNVTKKVYRQLEERVKRAADSYGKTNVITYLMSIAHLSHA